MLSDVVANIGLQALHVFAKLGLFVRSAVWQWQWALHAARAEISGIGLFRLFLRGLPGIAH